MDMPSCSTLESFIGNYGENGDLSQETVSVYQKEIFP
jgi:hypothetical protein